MNNTDITSSVEQVSSENPQYGAEFAVIVNGMVRCYIRTREAAEKEAARIVRGIEADRRWFAK